MTWRLDLSAYLTAFSGVSMASYIPVAIIQAPALVPRSHTVALAPSLCISSIVIMLESIMSRCKPAIPKCINGDGAKEKTAEGSSWRAERVRALVSYTQPTKSCIRMPSSIVAIATPSNTPSCSSNDSPDLSRLSPDNSDLVTGYSSTPLLSPHRRVCVHLRHHQLSAYHSANRNGDPIRRPKRLHKESRDSNHRMVLARSS